MLTRPPSPEQPLRIGTRGSPLALAQAQETCDRLVAAHGLPAAAFTIVAIATSGDRFLNESLAQIGGKGLFTKEIDEALLQGSIDIAVHSMKDVPTVLPDGLAINCLLPREDPRDAFVSHSFAGLEDLPQRAVVGTSSIRRRAQLAYRRPDLLFAELRGNVQSRLRKLDEGAAVATLLAVAGIKRLGLNGPQFKPVSADRLLPAVAQGAIGVQQRIGDETVAELLVPLNDVWTQTCVHAERAFLAVLDGSCHTPIAALAEVSGTRLRLRGEIIRPDGSARMALADEGDLPEAEAIGREMGYRMRTDGGVRFFS